ncbi:MAG: hypothetical protein JNL82_14575 [Myxococcales bacterium]|nr:hypothetical protein [Myxococcales bacterium]
MHTETTTAATTAPTTTGRKNRSPKNKPDAATVAANEVLAATTAEAKPAVQLTPEQTAALEKAKAKKAKADAAAAREAAKIAALERGEEPPTANTKGLPPVVKMNELGALARQLHRAAGLLASPEVSALNAMGDPSRIDAAETAARYRNMAAQRWLDQHDLRASAGAADNDTLAPLGLAFTADGDWVLAEKPKATE